MTNSNYPLIYSDEHELQVKNIFQKCFTKKQAKFIRLINEVTHNSCINMTQLSSIIRIVLGKDHQIDSKNIDCGYIMLCRGVPFEKIDTIGPDEMRSSLLGFNAKNIGLIFHELEEGSKYNSSDYLKIDSADI
mmetsp:Transcript_26369/g.40248  ORF Transcript_26369/g.40248 Transcript_26369/m.40248 type:complete len:133 (-) Transcript_26369:3660-4058(-)